MRKAGEKLSGPWTKVQWSDFFFHFLGKSTEEIAADVEAGLEAYKRYATGSGEPPEGDDFLSAQMRKGIEAADRRSAIYAANGAAGGKAKAANSAQSKNAQSNFPSAGSPIGNAGNATSSRASGDNEHLDSSTDGTFSADEAPLPKRECEAPHRIPAKAAKAEPKVATGDLANVYLTASEAAQLADRLGPERAAAYVTSLSLYKGKTGKTYKSDYAAVLSWSRKDEAQGVAADGHKMTQRERLAKYCDDRRRRAGLARHPGTIAPEPAHATDPPKAILPPSPPEPIPDPPKAIAPPSPAQTGYVTPLDDFDGMPEDALDDIFGALDGRRSREDERNDIFRDYT